MSTIEQNETIGILVCTHSVLAEGIKKAIEMLMGPQEKFETIGLYEGDDIFNLSKEITKRINTMGTGENLVFYRFVWRVAKQCSGDGAG